MVIRVPLNQRAQPFPPLPLVGFASPSTICTGVCVEPEPDLQQDERLVELAGLVGLFIPGLWQKCINQQTAAQNQEAQMMTQRASVTCTRSVPEGGQDGGGKLRQRKTKTKNDITFCF